MKTIQSQPCLLRIGNSRDLNDLEAIYAEEVQSILQLSYEQPPAMLPRDRVVLRFPLLDGTDNSPAIISSAIGCLVELLRQRLHTLVCCSAGMSRSPAIVAASLSVIESRSIESCLSEIAALHPIDVSPGLRKDVCSAVSAMNTAPCDK